MTISVYILPMSPKRRVVFLVYEGFELLDLSGPAAVFSTANVLAAKNIYDVAVVSPSGGVITSGCGIGVSSTQLASLSVGKFDTVLVVGAYEASLKLVMANTDIAKKLRSTSRRAERFGSICTGAFLLGAAGLLAGRRVATHWSGCARLGAAFENASVESNALYVVDGELWTSAGVTTGIDMALAMLEHDHGSRLMGQVAKQLVVYAHRPGHQSQFSSVLKVQSSADGAYSELTSWLENRLDKPIKVADMARQVSLSERTFHRKFSAATGITPSRFLEDLRLEWAKRHLEADLPVKSVAARVGFKSESAFRTAFRARYGVTPSHHARMHKPDTKG